MQLKNNYYVENKIKNNLQFYEEPSECFISIYFIN